MRRRGYGDRCGIARALDLVGDRWALLVVRELLLGAKRFSDLRLGLPAIASDVLAQRLRELEAGGVLERRTLPPPAASRVYALTPFGRELEPIVLALGVWGSRIALEPAAAFSPDSAMLALKAMFSPARTKEATGTYAVRLDGVAFSATVRRRAFDVRRGEPESPDATIVTRPATLSDVLFHGRPLDAAEAAGEVEIHGDRRAALGFLDAFRIAPDESALLVASAGASR
jgi:DNA-binding HxlR family transcriptional regulator